MSEVKTLINDWPVLDPDALPGLKRVLSAVERHLEEDADPSAASLSSLGQVVLELHRVMPKVKPTDKTTAILHMKRGAEEVDEQEERQKRRRTMAADLFGIKEEMAELRESRILKPLVCCRNN